MRAGIIGAEDLPGEPIAALGSTGSQRIDALVHDLVENSDAAGEIVQGERVGAAMLELREFMFERVYLGPEARREHARIENVLRALFAHFWEHPQELPDGVEGASHAQHVTDYVAGMTDRFCIREFQALAVPRSFA